MDDLISRQAVLDRIAASINKYGGRYTYDQLDMWGLFTQMVTEFPSAQKTGTWIEDDDRIIAGHCSLCGWKAIYDETDVLGMPYCPNCGARMESE